MISIVLALLTSASNATASVLQRRAASQAKSTRPLGLGLIADLLHRKVWLAGIGMVIVASLLQAGALATGPIALVQPIFIVELPLTLLLSSWVWHRRLAPRTWGAVALVTISLGTGLAAAQPSGGNDHAATGTWILALIATGAFEAVLITSALRVSGEPRAALLGLAAACGYALTAALLKEAVAALDRGPAAFFSTWQLYGVAVAGVGSLFLLQNALQAGTLAASQPMLTVGDALISITYGVMLFHEQLRLGWFLIPEIVCLVLIVVGYIEIAKSPVAMAHDEEAVAPSPPVAVDAPAQAAPDPAAPEPAAQHRGLPAGNHRARPSEPPRPSEQALRSRADAERGGG
ncbi:MAG: DMT family transporter [Streptosporangiaceae bacterium]